MSATPDPILFEAVSRPASSFSRPGFGLVVALACLGSAVPAILFAAMGAWPVLGFLGVEVPVVLALIAWQARGAARVRERLVLTATGLTIQRTDHRGRSRALQVEPYWARVEEDATQGLALVQRGRRIALGAHLGEAERAAYAEALRAALRRYRLPEFDNPQLRG